MLHKYIIQTLAYDFYMMVMQDYLHNFYINQVIDPAT